MKKRKAISIILAGTMACAALPLSAMHTSAADSTSTYAPGDVDMDGHVTGHDTAVLSRFLYEGDVSLTKQQLLLADVNGDGAVSQADLDQIHEGEEYQIGVVISDGFDEATPKSVIAQMCCAAAIGAGYSVTIGADIATDAEISLDTTHRSLAISELEYNLLDVDGNGNIDENDLFATLYSLACMGAEINDSIYLVDGRYDVNFNMASEEERAQKQWEVNSNSMKVLIENLKDGTVTTTTNS